MQVDNKLLKIGPQLEQNVHMIRIVKQPCIDVVLLQKQVRRQEKCVVHLIQQQFQRQHQLECWVEEHLLVQL